MAISLVQTANGTLTSGTSFSITTSSTQAGALLVVAISRTSPDAPSSVTDNQGNTYTTIFGSVFQGPAYMDTYYAYNATAGVTSVTITYTGTPNGAATVREYSGLTTSDPLDKFASAGGSSSTPSSGATATTTQADELVIGVNVSSNTVTAGAGYGNLSDYGGFAYRVGMEDKIVSTTGAQTATFSQALTSFRCGVATFKEATATTETLSTDQYEITFGTASSTKTQPATARIANIVTKTQPGIARISHTNTKTQGAIARVANSPTKTQTSIARIANIPTKTQLAVARIQAIPTKLQTATARIVQDDTVTKTQNATARIQQTVTKTQTATARISQPGIKTQPAISRISHTFTKTQSATAALIVTRTKTQSATALIYQTVNRVYPAIPLVVGVTPIDMVINQPSIILLSVADTIPLIIETVNALTLDASTNIITLDLGSTQGIDLRID